MSALTTIPTDDIAAFYSFPENVRTGVKAFLAEMKRMQPPLEQAFKVAARNLGKSWRSVRTTYYRVQRDGWRGAIDWRKAGGNGHGIPRELAVEFLRRVESYQRNGGAAAYAGLVSDWKDGKPIPGYPDASAYDRANLPPGWSYQNLMRAAKKVGTKAQMMVARRGKAAAYALLPQVFSTRVGLYPGSHMMFDDMWHDDFVHWRGKAVRMLEFDALDVFSGCKFDWIIKPRFERADGTKDDLKEYQFRSLLAKILGTVGYSERGTVYMTEHGKAAIREALQRLLYDMSKTAIRVKESGIIGAEQTIAGYWRGAGDGNPRHKAALESIRNLIHNRLSALPAQTGLSPEMRPEQTAGLLKYHDMLMRAAAVMPAHLAQLFRLPLMPMEQFGELVAALYDALNRRGEDPRFGTHELEGWAECGHMITEFRLSTSTDAWIRPAEFLALGPGERNAITALVRGDAQAYSRTRPLSPREVWEAGRRELRPFPAPVLAEIILGGHGLEEGPLAKVLPVSGAYFEFADQLLGPGEHRYSSEVTDLHGRRTELRHGEKFLCVVDPAGTRLFVHDGKGRFVGTAARDLRPSRADDAALKDKFSEVNRRTAGLLSDLSARHREQGKANLDLMRHNAGVMDQAANPTRAEDAKSERQARRAAEAGAAMARELETTAETTTADDGEEPIDLR